MGKLDEKCSFCGKGRMQVKVLVSGVSGADRKSTRLNSSH